MKTVAKGTGWFFVSLILPEIAWLCECKVDMTSNDKQMNRIGNQVD